MQYQRSLVIEQRLETVLRLIRTGKYSTPRLAEELGVSIPTISRCVEALRDRGHEIVAENQNGTWRFVLQRKSVSVRTAVNVSAR
jgi:Mn-dependent DtxR family transcriptional regulator